MSLTFTNKDIDKFSEVWNVKPQELGGAWSWRLKNDETKQSLVLTIYNNVELGKNKKGTLLSVQTHHGYYELHDCQSFLVFEPDEVIFINANDTFVSSLIIGGRCTCSMYTNISRDILNSDFSKLDPAVLLSAMQLSLTESILP